MVYPAPAPQSRAYDRPRHDIYAMAGTPMASRGYVREPMMSRPEWTGALSPAAAPSHRPGYPTYPAPRGDFEPQQAAAQAWHPAPARKGMSNRTIALLSAAILSLGALIVMIVLTVSGGDDSSHTPSSSKSTASSTSTKPASSDSNAGCLQWCGH